MVQMMVVIVIVQIIQIVIVMMEAVQMAEVLLNVHITITELHVQTVGMEMVNVIVIAIITQIQIVAGEVHLLLHRVVIIFFILEECVRMDLLVIMLPEWQI